MTSTIEQATYETATTKYITVSGVKYAYRFFGNLTSGALPLFMGIHFRGNMDWWDPLLINSIVAHRPILFIDNSGVGRSEGQVQESYQGWAAVTMSVVKALGIEKLDVFGFSMGGFMALTVALEYPEFVRKLIIAGSGPSQGEGMEAADPQFIIMLAQAQGEEANKAGLLRTFFSASPEKQKLGEAWYERMTKARSERAPLLEGDGVQQQVDAAMRYLGGEHREEGTYDRLDQIKIPVLIANGSNDILAPTHNSYVLYKKLVNAEPHLHLYPDSSHGFLDEYHEHFSMLVNTFLDG